MRSQHKHYDAVVVGAGPAGSSASKYMALNGLKVLMIEQRLKIGSHIQCAEFVPVVLARYAPLRECDIAQRVQGIQTYISGKLANTLRAPGYILNRAAWDENQVNLATAAGVSVLTAARVTSVTGRTLSYLQGAESSQVSADFILGCDGPHSIIAKALNNRPQKMCAALQHEMTLTRPMEHAAIYFDFGCYGGYGWVFPKGKTANIGVAVHESWQKSLKTVFDEFCQKVVALGMIQPGTVWSSTGGLIPMGGLAKNLANEHMLLAGDAAGCTHPVTGAGIMNAVVSGRLAAMAVIRQTNGSSDQIAAVYSRLLTEEFGAQFAIARERLKRRNQLWSENESDFNKLIRNSWIAFPEYYAQI